MTALVFFLLKYEYSLSQYIIIYLYYKLGKYIFMK